MKTYNSLINEINSLPKGNLYRKIIKNHVYYYYQFSENNVKHTRIVKKEEFQDLVNQINKRILLETELFALIVTNARPVVLSKNAKEYTGYIMSENDVVAEFDHGVLIHLDYDRCPLIIKRTKSLEAFLKTRAIDTSRTNSRLLRKLLNIKETTEEKLSLCAYSASISDDYWFKPKHSKLKYENIAFTSDAFFDLALKGILSPFPKRVSPTPELTTVGSYEKGWKKIDNEWWLYKVGTDKEIFSELFYSKMMEKLNYPTATYEKHDSYIRSKNFATKYNFEPMISLAGEDDSYENVFSVLLDINEQIASAYLQLAYYDAIFFNIDRHNENCGILRDKKTGEIVSLAPNFDNNLCLISRVESLNTNLKEGFLNNFAKFLKNNELAKELLFEANMPIITEDIINNCIDEIDMSVNREQIIKFVITRYQYLTRIINN